jgi:hypothetical protein
MMRRLTGDFVSALPESNARGEGFLPRLLERRRVRFVCVAFIATSLGLLAISFATADQGDTAFGSSLGADYAGFYSAAMILGTTPERLYDFQRQDEVQQALHPKARGRLPYLYPPFVALAFRPLALLPYDWSFAVWLVISGSLYLAGLVLALRSLPGLASADRSLVLLLALSFEPFLMECWMGGQSSAFGFFCLALVCCCLHARRPIVAGMALGLCLYKPTLLVLLLPLLLLSRQWRILVCVGMTALGLAGLSLAAVGWPVSRNYVQLLLGVARTTTGSEGAIIPSWKYVDLNSFLRLLLGTSPVNQVLLLLIVAGPLAFLAAAWWRSVRYGEDQRRVVWAATITWTLLANLYVGVYDSVLVVLSVLLTAEVLYQRGQEGNRWGRAFPVLLLLLYLAPWFSQHLALAAGVQVYSLVLLALGVYQLILIRAFTAPCAEGIRDSGALAQAGHHAV